VDTVQTLFGVMIWFLCPILILLILIQGGAGDLSSTFGGGGQLDSTLGVGASRKMGKITGWLSVSFLLIVVFMAIPPGGDYGSKLSEAGASEGPSAVSSEDPAAPVDVAPATITEPVAPLEPAESPAQAPAEPAADAPAEPAADAPTEADQQNAGLEIGVEAPVEEE
jgi:protein translocase SecG subunit